MRSLVPTLALLFVLGCPSLSAQPRGAGQTITARFSSSASAAVTHAGLAAGDVGVSAYALEWRASSPVGPATGLSYGLAWERYEFSTPAATAVPSDLQKTSIVLGISHRLGEAWRLLATISPGLARDGDAGSSDAFNAPALLLATWARNPELSWVFGLRADGHSERPILPIVGVNWRFAPQWNFNLGLPRAGLRFEATPTVKLDLGFTLQGGTFAVGRDRRPVVPPGGSLADSKLDYHEIRVGLAVEWELRENLALTVESGVITDQKFDYFDRGYTVDGGGQRFLTFALNGRF